MDQHSSPDTTPSLFLRFIPLCLLFSLTACSQLLVPDEEEAASVRERTSTEMVIEGLVNAAVNLGPLDIAASRDAENQEEDAALASLEPVIPTVPMTANRVVERSINDYLQNRQSTLRMWIERGHTYFPMIEQIFEEEGVPDELKYIALGESGLSPTARSWVGAAGMWQFMPATGRSAGLAIDSYVDERRDPEKSTRAAARHLKELYEVYGQNWHLALAGYNCSYRCISRAVTRAGGTIENPPSFWEIYPYLPNETRGFIPKFIAASLLVSNPEMYGINADTFGHELAYDVVEISGMMSLADAATLAGTTTAILRTLNPELLKTTLPDRAEPYPLKIPAGSFQRFADAFSRLPVESKTVPTEYEVRRGDTLGAIARKLETSVSDLQKLNSINGHLIHPGQKLLIPGSGSHNLITLASTEARTVEYGPARFLPIQLTEEFQLVEVDRSTPENPVFAVTLADDFEDELMVPTIYKVQSGDTLGHIADRFRVSVGNLRQWNSISGSMIRVGQELTIHTGAAPTIATYQVQRGDSLAAIARRFGVSVESIKQRNGLTGDLIFPGQSLQLN